MARALFAGEIRAAPARSTLRSLAAGRLPRLAGERLDAMPRAAVPERGPCETPAEAGSLAGLLAGAADASDHGARAEAYAAAATRDIDAALDEARQLRGELEGVIGRFGREPGLPPAALQGRPSR